MKLLGNYAHWIKQEWIDHILNNDGWGLPRDWGTDQKSRVEGMIRLCGMNACERALSAGYDFSQVKYHVYNKSTSPFDLKFTDDEDDVEWRFVKLKPGDVMPMHLDSDIPNYTCRKYWMPLQDSDIGHVFIWKDTAMLNWKKGDLFQFDDANEWHGATNIGFTPRIILNINVWNPDLNIVENGIN